MRRTARLFRAAAVAAVAAAGPAFAQSPCPPDPCATAPSATATLTAPPGATTAAPSSAASSVFGGTEGGAGLGSSVSVANPGGYIDGASPATQFRLRYDSAYRNNRPDRAEFFYPKCGCFGRDANGPLQPESRVDSQDLAAYMEYAVSPRFSVFGEVPIRAINPEVNENVTGLSDVNFGFKYAAILCSDRVVTFQLRTTAPTGVGRSGLGQENWRVEPGILWQEQVADRLTFFGELRDSIPVDRNTDFAGNVLRYGIGSAYMLYSTPSLRVMPVTEIVGWTVLSGRELADGQDVSARGATIVNVKGGVRFGFGCTDDPSSLGRSDLYLGYGRAITGEVWYKEIARAEFRVRF